MPRTTFFTMSGNSFLLGALVFSVQIDSIIQQTHIFACVLWKTVNWETENAAFFEIKANDSIAGKKLQSGFIYFSCSARVAVAPRTIAPALRRDLDNLALHEK